MNRGKLWLRDDQIEGFIDKMVTPSGTGAKVDVPKRYIGKRAYIVVTKA